MKSFQFLRLDLWSDRGVQPARTLRLAVALCALLLAACGGGYGGSSSGSGGMGGGYGGTAPMITSFTVAPSQMVTANTMVTFTVMATGTAPLHYQWMFNSNNVGTDMNTYVIASAQAANSGTYAVTVSNASGMKTSSPMMLTVM